MPIRRLHTETRYSEAVIHNGAVYLSGQLADDLTGDIRQQTRETLASIERLLDEAGTSKARLLSATIHLGYRGRLCRDERGMGRLAASGTAPARTTVQALMYAPDVRVEITVVAAMPDLAGPVL